MRMNMRETCLQEYACEHRNMQVCIEICQHAPKSAVVRGSVCGFLKVRISDMHHQHCYAYFKYGLSRLLCILNTEGRNNMVCITQTHYAYLKSLGPFSFYYKHCCAYYICGKHYMEERICSMHMHEVPDRKNTTYSQLPIIRIPVTWKHPITQDSERNSGCSR